MADSANGKNYDHYWLYLPLTVHLVAGLVTAGGLGAVLASPRSYPWVVLWPFGSLVIFNTLRIYMLVAEALRKMRERTH